MNTKYLVTWRFNDRNHSATYDSFIAAQLFRMGLISNGYNPKEVTIHLVQSTEKGKVTV